MVLMGPVTYAKHLVAAYLRQQALTGSAKSMLSDAGVRRCSQGCASGRLDCGRRGGWCACGAWLYNPAKRQNANPESQIQTLSSTPQVGYYIANSVSSLSGSSCNKTVTYCHG